MIFRTGPSDNTRHNNFSIIAGILIVLIKSKNKKNSQRAYYFWQMKSQSPEPLSNLRFFEVSINKSFSYLLIVYFATKMKKTVLTSRHS